MNAFPLSSAAGYDGHVSTMYHWGAASGGGAVDGRDGFVQVGPMCAFGALILPNAEMSEQLYPVRVQRQELRLDGAGAGKYRGGPGAYYVADILFPSEVSFRAESVKESWSYGTNGGTRGTTSTVTLTPVGGKTYNCPTYGVIDIEPSRLELISGGGGGWGDPLERDADRVLRDVSDEVVSVEAAHDVYGVVLDASRTSVDGQQTDARRQALREAREAVLVD
jgi:N-methylhydantoinase B